MTIFRRKIPVPIVIIFLVLLFNGNCIVPYTPELYGDEELVVIEGTITDQKEINTVKLSKTFPSWKSAFPRPLKKCKVWITDNTGNIDTLSESYGGTYVTDTAVFRGVPGRTYTLHVKTAREEGSHTYESAPVRMIPSPPIDRIHYEKKTYLQEYQPVEACQIYLDTHDPAGQCDFYRWSYSETWQIRIPFEDVVNRDCWLSALSQDILLKSTINLSENIISDFPLKYIPNTADKLGVKYSILVRQYSLNEEEYLYWERMKAIQEEVGGLYDIIPSEIPNNVFCADRPADKVLGYFSVSAVTSERFFITETFTGLNTAYAGCLTDTIFNPPPLNLINGLNESVWLLVDDTEKEPPYIVVTAARACGDCTIRGTKEKPSFWDDDK